MTTATETRTVTDEFVELNGIRFHYRDWPSAKAGAQDLVLLHGFTGHTRTWDTVARAMSANYRVLVLDQRGHGESGWATADGYGPDEMVADIEAFVGALGLKRFVLLGLSMGGQNAIGYAGKQPPELERLVIVDVGPEGDAAGLSRIANSVQASDRFDAPEDALARALGGSPNADPDEVRHRALHNLMRTADGKWTWRYDRALRDPSNPRPRRSPEDGWALVANINVPTLLIRGEISDILPRAVADRMVQTIPDCRFVEVAGSGHSVHQERPAGFLEALRTFL